MATKAKPKGWRVVCSHCQHRRVYPTHAAALAGLDEHIARKCSPRAGGGYVVEVGSSDDVDG